jgi:hypothetical protein
MPNTLTIPSHRLPEGGGGQNETQVSSESLEACYAHMYPSYSMQALMSTPMVQLSPTVVSAMFHDGMPERGHPTSCSVGCNRINPSSDKSDDVQNRHGKLCS